MGVKDEVVPSFTGDWGAVAKRPLRKRRPFVGSDVEGHVARSCMEEEEEFISQKASRKAVNSPPKQTTKAALVCISAPWARAWDSHERPQETPRTDEKTPR